MPPVSQKFAHHQGQVSMWINMVVPGLVNHRDKFRNTGMGKHWKGIMIPACWGDQGYMERWRRDLIPQKLYGSVWHVCANCYFGGPRIAAPALAHDTILQNQWPWKKRIQLQVKSLVVVWVFARLKACWRCLCNCLDAHMANTSHIIITCCTLHNICEGDSQIPLLCTLVLAPSGQGQGCHMCTHLGTAGRQWMTSAAAKGQFHIL